jgi:Fic family protein
VVIVLMARGRPSRTTVYARLEGALVELRERLGGLPSPQESEAIWSDIWHQEAHHSTALEGNTLILREVEKLLDEGRAVGSKPLKEYMEVKGYADAAKWVYAHALEPDEWTDDALINVQELRRIHHLAMTPVRDVAPHEHATDAESPGNFRTHDIHPFPGGMTPPSWALVEVRTRDWVDGVNRTASTLRGVSPSETALPEQLARLHNEFEQVHPFLDGNGRTGRLVLNLVLVRLGYPPVIIFKRQRVAYLAAMVKADAGDHGPLGELIARAMHDNLNRFIVPSIAGPARIVPLASLVDKNFSLAALRQAAQRGRLEARQGPDGIWRSSRRAVEDYQRIKNSRRPKTENEVDDV